jgi:CspA family cold shock protein
MTKGKIKWYDETKGFGFIRMDNDENIFVHRTGLSDSFSNPQPEQEVTFDTKQGDKGLIAINVKPAN